MNPTILNFTVSSQTVQRMKHIIISQYDDHFYALREKLFLKIKFFLKLPMIFKRNHVDE